MGVFDFQYTDNMQWRSLGVTETPAAKGQRRIFQGEETVASVQKVPSIVREK